MSPSRFFTEMQVIFWLLRPLDGGKYSKGTCWTFLLTHATGPISKGQS
jgi:hypothetical protein